MPLFGGARDVSLIRHFSRELINSIIEQKVGYYKISLEKTETNIYGEAAKGKTYNDPVLINCLIDRGDMITTTDEAGVTVVKTVSYRFLRDDLKNFEIEGLEEGYEIFPEVGDVILWNGNYYEVDGINENDLILGKDPEYSYSEDTDNFGSSLSIIVSSHYIRPETVGIEQQRL